MHKYKMKKDWKFAIGGIQVVNYKKDKVYLVNDRCAELCEKYGHGEPASKGDVAEISAEEKAAQEKANEIEENNKKAKAKFDSDAKAKAAASGQ